MRMLSLVRPFFSMKMARSPTTLEEGGHLDQVAQKDVGLAMGSLIFSNFILGAHFGDLGQQVGVLSAGDLILINLGVGGDHAALVGFVDLADMLIVAAQLIQAPQSPDRYPARCPFRASTTTLREGWLVQGAHGLDGQVHDIHASLGSLQHGGDASTGGVVGVQVNGDVELGLEGFHQLLGRIGVSAGRPCP